MKIYSLFVVIALCGGAFIAVSGQEVPAEAETPVANDPAPAPAQDPVVTAAAPPAVEPPTAAPPAVAPPAVAPPAVAPLAVTPPVVVAPIAPVTSETPVVGSPAQVIPTLPKTAIQNFPNIFSQIPILPIPSQQPQEEKKEKAFEIPVGSSKVISVKLEDKDKKPETNPLANIPLPPQLLTLVSAFPAIAVTPAAPTQASTEKPFWNPLVNNIGILG